MGGRIRGPICSTKSGGKLGDGTCRAPTTARGPAGQHNGASAASRSPTKHLHGVDAETVLKTELPFVLPFLNDRQLEQIQRIVDAPVVNPALQQEIVEVYRQAASAHTGSQTKRDAEVARQVDRIRAARSTLPTPTSESV